MKVVTHSLLSDSLQPPEQGSSVHGILQAIRLEWVAISFSRGFSQRRDWTQVSCIAIWDSLPSVPPGREALTNSKFKFCFLELSGIVFPKYFWSVVDLICSYRTHRQSTDCIHSLTFFRSLYTCQLLSKDFTWSLKFVTAPKHFLYLPSPFYISPKYSYQHNIYFTYLFFFTPKNINSFRTREFICFAHCCIPST